MKKQLTKPTKIGLFLNEPAEVYHAEAGYISSSPLPFMGLSPAHFFARWNNGVEPTQEMDNGSFIHSLCLEQDINQYVARPVNEKGDLVRSNSKEYKEFLAANVGKKPIKPELYKSANEVLDAICINKPYMNLYDHSEAEVSIYAIDEETGLPLKARTDLMPKWLVEAILKQDMSLFAKMGKPENLFVHDLKSTGNLRAFKNQIFVAGYNVRLMHYWQTIRSLVKQSFNFDIGLPGQLSFTAIEQSAPFGSQNHRLKPFEIQESYNVWRQYINTISACLQDGYFPGYATDWIDVERPSYLQLSDDLDFTGVG